MKNLILCRSVLIRFSLLVVFCLLAAIRSFSASSSPPPATDWNVAMLDQIIAAVPAGEKFARIDDMLVPVDYLQSWRNQLAGVPQPKSAFYNGFIPWTSGNVYYAFDVSVTAANRKVFLDCAAEWATFANLHFIARTAEANYILVTNNATLNGGLSAVGMSGGAQLLQIGPTAWVHSVVVHELGHALGMCHEQQRSDRDSYVTIVTNNIQTGHLSDFVILTTSANKGAYDFLSVMHYGRTAFSTNGLNTIQTLPAYNQYLNLMGQQFDPVLSTNDRAGMISIYGAGPGASSVVTNTLDSGPGSLRAALYYGFDHPNTTITFNIPTTDPGYSNFVFNILPSDTLPSLVHSTILNGNSEPTNSNTSGPEILINGALCQSPVIYASGLQLKGSNCVVRGVTVNNFNQFGILITSTNAQNNTVAGCYVGVDPTGASAVANGILPVQIESGAVSNTVGGTTAADRNILSGSTFQGLVITGTGTSFNAVKGNYIGVNAAGTAALANGGSGVRILNAASANVIGGTDAGAGNVISGNQNYGVELSNAGANGNSVQGNYIGLNAAGTAAIPNAFGGVVMYGGASSNSIGGFASGAGNIISGNSNDGVYVTDPSSIGNLIAGNYIGLNVAGTAALANSGAGVDFQGGTVNNVVASNVISGNLNYGIYVQGSFNSIWGNYIGLNAAGTGAVGNSLSGVAFNFTSLSNTVGGVVSSARNVISGNHQRGILLFNSPVSKNAILGNYIGLNAAGTAAIANTSSGVEISGGPSANIIGGSGGGRNFISGNGQYGISIYSGSSANVIQGNTIGLNGTNGAAVPNAQYNIAIFGAATSNLVGGVTAGAANLISGSTTFGVLISDIGTTNNAVRGNSIFNNVGNAIFLNANANRNIAAPTLTSAATTTGTTVSGSYSGGSGLVYQLDFYSDVASASPVQGMTYLGSKTVTSTGPSSTFTAALGAVVPAGRSITASITDPAGNTSQLSSGRAVTLTSTPNDGIPDAWRTLYFGGTGTNSTSYAAGDPDHDGLSNLQEFLAGTNPTNAASVFKLTAQNPVSTANAVSINSSNGIVYRVWYSDDLTAGRWDILADQVIGNGANVLLADPAASVMPRRFYRGQVLW